MREVSNASRRSAAPVLTVGAAAAAASSLLSGPEIGYERGQAVISTAAFLFGAWAFWHHGGRQITAAGVYSLASAAFVGYAGWWWLLNSTGVFPGELFAATFAAYLTHLAAYCLFWHSQARSTARVDLPFATKNLSNWTINLGLLALLASIALSFAVPGLRIAYSSGAFVGVILLVTGLAIRPSGNKFGLHRSIVAAAAVGLYLSTIFTGYGRLTVVTLLVACAAVVSSRFSTRIVKFGILAGCPLVVAALNFFRENVVAAQYGTAASNSNDPGSIVNPLFTFARLLDPSNIDELGQGSTFWASMVILVPRSIWPDKPVGFGTELTALLEPQLLSVGHSMAALVQGEWYFNFGPIGLVLMVVVVGLFVRFLDRRLIRAMARTLDNRRQVLRIAIFITLAAGLADFAWVGTFTYVSRSGFHVLVLLLLGVIASRRPLRKVEDERVAPGPRATPSGVWAGDVSRGRTRRRAGARG